MAVWDVPSLMSAMMRSGYSCLGSESAVRFEQFRVGIARVEPQRLKPLGAFGP